MAKLVYDDTGRLLFTKEMKEEYTILMPQMLPVHFGMFQRLLELEGYKVDMLTSNHRGIIDEGLKYVHNDTCYPALLVIGQLIDAIKHGGYDPHKVALFITQTGGGCRASNYIHLLRKALEKADLAFVPVISVNLSGLEKNPGFSLTLPIIRKMVYAMMYGDIIVNVANQVRPYERERGATDAMVSTWQGRLIQGFQQGKGMSRGQMRTNFDAICADFASIPVTREQKVRVGVVGEIYVKFSPLGNNNLEDFLLSEGAEPVVPGLTDFMIFKIYNRVVDVDLYGGKWIKKATCQLFMKYIEACQKDMIQALERSGRFRAPGTFQDLHRMIQGYLGDGNKMGEGWLLTAEMLELIHTGTPNIVCTQPFGCLPNHIVGKGMLRKLKDDYPYSNVVAIDYDPGATKINQENRIKLMLANAKALAKQQGGEAPAAAREAAPTPSTRKFYLPEGGATWLRPLWEKNKASERELRRLACFLVRSSRLRVPDPLGTVQVWVQLFHQQGQPLLSFWEPRLGKQVRHAVLRRLQPDPLGIPLQQLGRLAAGTLLPLQHRPGAPKGQPRPVGLQSRLRSGEELLHRLGQVLQVVGIPLLDIAQISLRRIAPVVQQDLVKAQLGQLHHQSDQIVLDRLTGWAAPPQLLRIGPPVAAVGPDGICLILGQGVVPEAGQAGHRVQLPAVEGLELAVDVRLSGVDPRRGGHGQLGDEAQLAPVCLHVQQDAVGSCLGGQRLRRAVLHR